MGNMKLIQSPMYCTTEPGGPNTGHIRGGSIRRSLKMILPVALLLLNGCATVQYAAYEKVGVHKRDLLVDRVEDARDAQDEAKEEFVSAYEQFVALVGAPGGDLPRTYKKLSGDLERAEDAAQEIDDRLNAVNRVANDLFREWQAELNQYTNPQYRASSEQKLAITRQRYGKLKQSMDLARSKIDPVLIVLQDHVLFLKHNLNAQALSNLQGEVVRIEGRVSDLVREMEIAISEANRFIQDVGAS